MIIIPVLALSALFKLANPDVTLHVSRATSDISVAHSGAEYEVVLEYLSRSQLSQVSQLSLPGQSPLGVEHDVQFGSPFDLELCFAPLPTPSRKSSPTSRAITHESGSLNHKSTTLCGTICRLLASKVPSTGSSSFPSTSSSSLSTSDFHSHGRLNASSTLNSTSLPTYGPEWEWSPRDLIVYVPQPSCPVPVLRSDMSTLPTLHRCTLASQDYYADLVRVAMLSQTCVVSHLDWCGRDSEELQTSLKFTRQKFMKLVIAFIRERELAQLTVVHEYERASQPIALLFSALVVCYGLFMYTLSDVLNSCEEGDRVSGTQQSSSCVVELIESSVPPRSQARLCDPILADGPTETSTKHKIPSHLICIVALAVVYALLICVLYNILESKNKKKDALGDRQNAACGPLEPSTPCTSQANSSDTNSAIAVNETKAKVAVVSNSPRREVSAPRPSSSSESRPQASIGFNFYKPRHLCSPPPPPRSPVDPEPFAVSEPPSETVEAILEDTPAVCLSLVDEGAVGAEENPEVEQLAQAGQEQDNQSTREEVQEPLEYLETNAPEENVEETAHNEGTQSESDSLEKPDEIAPSLLSCLQADSPLPLISETLSQDSTTVASSPAAKPFDQVESMSEKDAEVTRMGREEQEEKKCEVRRWEAKLEEIKLKLAEEQAEARRLAGEVSDSADVEPVARESEAGWETVVRRKKGRGSSQNSGGSRGSRGSESGGSGGSGGGRAPRRA
ncbi:hypothetical protein BDV93DRAFT_545761 [Ceratobasidium sp. AG-I]|nr:hypothetical protein BDV93DRAFT_545761 [Ceratobasidium sp. AG-I]